MIDRALVTLVALVVLAGCQSRREFSVVNASGVELRVHAVMFRSGEPGIVAIQPGKTWRFKDGSPVDRNGVVRLEAAGCEVVYRILDAPWAGYPPSGRIELQIEPDFRLRHVGWGATEEEVALAPASRVCGG